MIPAPTSPFEWPQSPQVGHPPSRFAMSAERPQLAGMRKKRALPDGLANASYRTLRCHSGSLRYGRRAPGAVIPFSCLSTQRYLVIIIPFRQQRREERSGKRSRRGVLPSRPIVGAFVFPDFWENSLRAKSNLARLRDCGVNAIMTESDSYELSALDATHKAGLRFFAGIACFSDHASNFRSLNKRPELWPVLENGERRPQMEWYVGMSPTDRTRQEEALAEIKSIALNYPCGRGFSRFCTLALALGNRAQAWAREAARFNFRSGDAREV